MAIKRSPIRFSGGDYVVLLLCFLCWSDSNFRAVSGKSKKGKCSDFFFHIPTTATNDSGVLVPAAKYEISATYCSPTKHVPHRESTVQLLVHGGGFNKHYWSAFGPVGSELDYQPHNYSWIDYARAEGYHIVAIDRLGAGNSTQPDPAYVRVPPQLQILLAITSFLRQGGFVDGAPKFKKVIGVGHSLGSILWGLFLPIHPFALDATILTSFIVQFNLTTGNTSDSVLKQAPARTVFPKRFGNLNPGYVYVLNPRESFFGKDGEFDPAIPPLVFQRADVDATGEQSSIFAIFSNPNVLTFFNVSGTGFKGDVAFLTGAEDEAFCNADCGSGPGNLVEQSLAYYASTKGHRSAFEIPKSGHLLHYHYVARRAFKTAHNWLAESGY